MSHWDHVVCISSNVRSRYYATDMPGREEGLGTSTPFIMSHCVTFLSDSEPPRDGWDGRFVPKGISGVNGFEH